LNLERLTQRSQEALQEAQSIGVRNGHPEIDVDHLALALVAQEDGLFARLLARLEAPVAAVRAALEREVERRPRVSGGGAEPGKVYITARLQQVLVRAEDEAKRLKDEYVSVEHLALALLEDANSPVARALAPFGVTRDALLSALVPRRGAASSIQ
jgi:ATP-dependent Clp protease ATP-binding subunit ClpB